MASDLLIVYDNAVDRATVSADSTAGSTAVASNLKNDIKGKIHRSGYTGSVEYKFTWPTNQIVGAVVVPMTNVSTAAILKVDLYSDDNWTTSIFTGSNSAFTYSDISNWNNYSGSATANEFGSGRYSIGYSILGSNYTNVRSAKVSLLGDTSGSLIDTSRVVAGRAWRPTRYASNGIQFTIEDTSSKVKTNSGSIVVDPGFKYNNLSFDIKYMDETDRGELVKILKMTGSSKNVFVSVFPSSASRLRDDYSVYGTFVKSPLTYEIYGYYTNTISIEGW
jgi:hypothetical protein